MPLEEKLTPIAQKYCEESGGRWRYTQYINEGNSAAVFRIDSDDMAAALKVYDPIFFAGPNGNASIKRLEAHNKFIKHECPHLVQFYDARIFGDSAIVLMEFLPWQELADTVKNFPNNKILQVVQQIAEAAKFLDDHNVCHRDIKPENIAISDDFENAKLLDLGVLRVTDDPEGAGSDQYGKKPFLGTVQYSAPEYLLREEPDGVNIFDALTFYQIGAVMHDLIMKEEIYATEKATDNKHILAHAIYTQEVNISSNDVDPNIVLLAKQCLTKDPFTRTNLVTWDSFLNFGSDPVAANLSKLKISNSTSNDSADFSATQKEENRQLLIDATKCLLEQINLIRTKYGLPPLKKSRSSEAYDSVSTTIEILHRDGNGELVPVSMVLNLGMDVGSSVFSVTLISPDESREQSLLGTLPIESYESALETLQGVIAQSLLDEYAAQLP